MVSSLYTVFDHWRLPLGADQTPNEFSEALRDEAIDTRRPIGWSEAHGGFWVAVGYAESREILLDQRRFSARGVTFPAYTLPDAQPFLIAGNDEPEHGKYRRLVNDAFSPERVGELEDALRRDANVLIDRFIDGGVADIQLAFSREVPGRLIARILGVPPDHGDLYRTWMRAILPVADSDSRTTCMAEMEAYFADILTQRRARPGDDLLSVLTQAQIDGQPLSDDLIRDYFVLFLLGAGASTMYFLSNILWRLGWDAELRRQLLRKPQLVAPAIEEFLRLYGTTSGARLVTEAVQVGGVVMEPGQHVLVWVPSANRDPREFPYPDVFVPDRRPNRHLGFGHGIHKCLGLHLARLQSRVGLAEFLRRIPDWELDPKARPAWILGQAYGMSSVPIVFPPGGGYINDSWPLQRALEVAPEPVG
jgi:cytochrome P450